MPTAVTRPAAFPSPSHNHGSCLAEARVRAEQAFADRHMRLTDLRLLVFEEIASSHTAIGAYEVLDRLAQKGTRLAPVSVYRALEALQEAGIVHRLESRNAFFACHVAHPTGGGAQIILTCDKCGTIAEVAGAPVAAAIEAAAEAASFRARCSIVEVSGRCRHCA